MIPVIPDSEILERIRHGLRMVTGDLGFLLAAALLFAAGVWASAVTSRNLGVSDHGAIVVDEVAAFLLVLFFTGTDPFREAVASGTPIVAVPRSLDQFGAAARVEYFGIGQALVERELPAVDDVVERVAHVLGDAGIHERSAGL